jgi:hypothetical protein
MALVGQRVTVTHPNGHRSWTGKLVAIADDPSLVVDLDDGQRMVVQQTCTVAPADDPPPEPFPSHSVSARLVINGETLHIRARLGIDDNHAGDDAVQRRWWADLAFHPLKPPNEDTECTLRLGGRPGKGRILAGSTRMWGDGPPPTTARWERLATVDQGNHGPVYTWPDVPPTADHVIGARVPGWPDMQAVAGDLAALGDMLANLRQHIDERAADIAAPHIEQARADVVEAQEERDQWRERFTDLQREFQRQHKVVERRAVRAETAIARALGTMRANTLPPPAHPTDYQRGYQACADHVTTALNGTTDQQETDRG